jgi:DNA adenine methylase
MKKIKSPLRYPGGKSRAVDIIFNYIPKNIKRLASPFLGGGSVELMCASNDIEVFAYDIFEPVVSFWQNLLDNNEKLADEVEKYFPLSKDDFYHLQKTNTSMQPGLLQGAVFYVLNRASFSGSSLSGGMSPNHPRFTKSSIQKLRDFKINNFHVEQMDFKNSILKHKDDFLYLDPPYMLDKNNNLYGEKGNTHKNFDHEGLFELLKDKNDWIMSYNNNEKIQEMYKDFPQVFPQWSYGMSSIKQSNEILIFNRKT